MNLVVGATGSLGGEICRLLAEAGEPVRALVRPTSDAAKVQHLRSIGAEISEGDLADASSLERACAGAASVISTASGLAAGESPAAVDEQGHANLIAAAREARVGRFVFVSFVEQAVPFPLQDAKRAVERMLEGALPYTIVRSANFMEFWLGPFHGWDLANGRVSVLGPGDQKKNWVSLHDVARFVAASLSDPRAYDTVLSLAGDYASPNEIVAIVEESTGEQLEVEHVPIEQLQAEREAAQSPAAESIAALRLAVALGDADDHTAALREFVPDPLTARAFVLEQAVRGC
jgi:NADH dehydrogenase